MDFGGSNVKEICLSSRKRGFDPKLGKILCEEMAFSSCSYKSSGQKKPGGAGIVSLPRPGHNLVLTTAHEYIYINIIEVSMVGAYWKSQWNERKNRHVQVV